jgi:hypothetical protein
MKEDIIIKLLLMFAGLLLTYVIIYTGVLMNIESRCLEAGYPKARVDYKLNGFCVRTFGEITEVKPAE